jgi:hypothetical protein
LCDPNGLPFLAAPFSGMQKSVAYVMDAETALEVDLRFGGEAA